MKVPPGYYYEIKSIYIQNIQNKQNKQNMNYGNLIYNEIMLWTFLCFTTVRFLFVVTVRCFVFDIVRNVSFGFDKNKWDFKT